MILSLDRYDAIADEPPAKGIDMRRVVAGVHCHHSDGKLHAVLARPPLTHDGGQIVPHGGAGRVTLDYAVVDRVAAFVGASADDLQLQAVALHVDTGGEETHIGGHVVGLVMLAAVV